MVVVICVVTLALAATLPTGDAREVRVATTDELRRALADARPGTRILIAPGEYAGFRAANVRGSDGKPVVVAAEQPDKAPVFVGGVQLSDVAWIELAGLVVRNAPANGLNIDDGGSFETPSEHVVLRDLVVRDTGARGNEDGIKLSGVASFRLERCTVERWGRGGSAVDMVGCRDGLILDCTFRDREKDTASTGVQTKGGTRDVCIRRSRFEHAGERAINVGGSTALAYFRPKPEGYEARAITVEGCTFIGSTAPIAFVGVDGANVRWNTFYRPRKWFLRILQETREPGFVACRNGVFEGNLVVYRASEVSTPVNIGPDTDAESFTFARNYWYCVDEPGRAAPRLPVTERDPAGGADPRLRDAETGDVRLAQDSPARAHGADAFVEPAKPR